MRQDFLLFLLLLLQGSMGLFAALFVLVLLVVYAKVFTSYSNKYTYVDNLLFRQRLAFVYARV